MSVAQAAVVNEALEQIAAQTTITDLNDGTPAGDAAGVVYTPIINMLLRQLDPDFARTTIALTLLDAAEIPAVVPYLFEYAYPLDCLNTRQVRPPPTGVGALFDPFDPLPVRWTVAYDPNGGGPQVGAKVILTNQQNAYLVYTTDQMTEAQWDAMFRQAVVGRLAMPLAMAIGGRPDFARALMEEAAAIASQTEMVDDGV